MNYVYIVRCADNTYYTGWTNNLTHRLSAHNSGKGAKYTANRSPVTLMFCEGFATQSEAMGYEVALKKLTRPQKENLIANQAVVDAEYLTVLDQQDIPRGILPRSQVHRLGLRHAVVHLWVLTQREGQWGIWLQQRAHDRPLYPNLYDLTATGHVGAGETPLLAMLREAQEEVGLSLQAEQAQFVGNSRQKYERPNGYEDELVHSFVYCTTEPVPFVAGEEVAGMAWISCKSYAKACKGAEQVALEGETISVDKLCCIHKKEWAQVQKYIKALSK